MKKRILLFLVLALIVVAAAFFIHQSVNCHFRPMTNFGVGRTVSLDMDLENAVTDGICIPSLQQTEEGDGLFHFGHLYPEGG